MLSVQYTSDTLYIILYFYVILLNNSLFLLNLCSEVFEVISQEVEIKEMVLVEAYLSTQD